MSRRTRGPRPTRSRAPHRPMLLLLSASVRRLDARGKHVRLPGLARAGPLGYWPVGPPWRARRTAARCSTSAARASGWPRLPAASAIAERPDRPGHALGGSRGPRRCRSSPHAACARGGSGARSLPPPARRRVTLGRACRPTSRNREHRADRLSAAGCRSPRHGRQPPLRGANHGETLPWDRVRVRRLHAWMQGPGSTAAPASGDLTRGCVATPAGVAARPGVQYARDAARAALVQAVA